MESDSETARLDPEEESSFSGGSGSGEGGALGLSFVVRSTVESEERRGESGERRGEPLGEPPVRFIRSRVTTTGLESGRIRALFRFPGLIRNISPSVFSTSS